MGETFNNFAYFSILYGEVLIVPHYMYLLRTDDILKSSLSRENLSLESLIRSDTKQAVQSQKMARGLKFPICEVEGLYYLCSQSKGTEQLGSYCTADLGLCFRIYKKTGFLFLNALHFSRLLLNHEVQRRMISVGNFLYF